MIPALTREVYAGRPRVEASLGYIVRTSEGTAQYECLVSMYEALLSTPSSANNYDDDEEEEEGGRRRRKGQQQQQQRGPLSSFSSR